MRPLLDVRLESSEGYLVTPLLVDSGSEYCLATYAFARRLEITQSLSSSYAEVIQIGGQTVSALLGAVVLRVPGFDPVEITMGFVRDWTFAHAGILGQRGFFDRFVVIFDRANRRFGLVQQEEFDGAIRPPLAPG